MELDLDITDEEVEYLMLKYIRDQTYAGRAVIPATEIYEYLQCEAPADAEQIYMVLVPDALEIIKKYEAEHPLH
jgi:hypothetical protein